MSASLDKQPGDLLLRAGDDNYLGDPMVVEVLLRTMASNVLDERTRRLGSSAPIEEHHAVSMAQIFLGQNSDFTPMMNWNEPGYIDEFVTENLNINETDPLIRMKTFFIVFLIDLYNIAIYSGKPGILDEQWKPQVDALIDYYRDLLMGYANEVE